MDKSRNGVKRPSKLTPALVALRLESVINLIAHENTNRRNFTPELK